MEQQQFETLLKQSATVQMGSISIDSRKVPEDLFMEFSLMAIKNMDSYPELIKRLEIPEMPVDVPTMDYAIKETSLPDFDTVFKSYFDTVLKSKFKLKQ